MTDPACANCAAPLTGPYCAECGQHAHASARSLHALLHEVWHDLTHIEGRIVATLRRLLRQPGQLTLDYLSGQRTRYVPPFRLYLVLSVAYFGLSALHGHTELNGNIDDCTHLEWSTPGGTALLQRLCQRVVVDHGAGVMHTFGAALPKALFLFLPVVALVMAMLYRRSHRYYVEHLVLVLHNHAAAFAALTALAALDLLQRLLAAIGLGTLAQWLDGAHSLLDVAFVGAVSYYVYRSLRLVYALPRGPTLRRAGLLGLAYLVLLVLTVAVTFLFSVVLG